MIGGFFYLCEESLGKSLTLDAELLVGGALGSDLLLLGLRCVDLLGDSLDGVLSIGRLCVLASALEGGDDCATTSGGSVGVELDHSGKVAERVLLERELCDLLLVGKNLGNGLAVDEAGEVGDSHLGTREDKALLGALLSVGAEELVELRKGVGGPHDEAAEVRTGGELEEVEGRDLAELNAGDVAEGAVDGRGLLVDDHGALALHVAAVAHLALAGADLLGVDDALDVSPDANGLESLDGLLGLLDVGEGLHREHERDLGDAADAVAAGHDERRYGGGSKSRHNSVSVWKRKNNI